MPYKPHYIEYYLNNELFRQRIRRWANEHQNLFLEYRFRNTQSDFPTTHFIVNRLECHFDFQRIENDLEVILRNPNPNFHF
jgi:hypothetical protein